MATPPFVHPRHVAGTPRIVDFGGIPPARRSPPPPLAGRRPPRAPGFGLPCPDAGYALLLARLTEQRLVLEPAERVADATWAIATIAMCLAGLEGRAPFIGDLEIAESVLAYDGKGPPDFSRWRAHELAGIAQDPDLRQRLCDVTMLVELRDPHDLEAVRTWRGALHRAL
jgi:hypothetical protein